MESESIIKDKKGLISYGHNDTLISILRMLAANNMIEEFKLVCNMSKDLNICDNHGKDIVFHIIETDNYKCMDYLLSTYGSLDLFSPSSFMGFNALTYAVNFQCVKSIGGIVDFCMIDLLMRYFNILKKNVQTDKIKIICYFFDRIEILQFIRHFQGYDLNSDTRLVSGDVYMDDGLDEQE